MIQPAWLSPRRPRRARSICGSEARNLISACASRASRSWVYVAARSPGYRPVDGPTPRLSTTSPALPGVTRSWSSVDAFTQEVINARIYDGVHYRNSGEVGHALGTKVGELAAAKLLR